MTNTSDLPSAPSAPSIPREIWVLVVAAFCVAIGFGLVAPVLPAYARSFDVGVQAAAAIISVFAVMRLLFAPAGGALVVRWGERSVYLSGLVIVALSTGACALAQDYWQLLIFRSLGGVGSTMFTVSATALIVRLSPPTIRGRISGHYGAGFLLGNILGPVLGGMTSGFGYRVPFLAYAVTLLIAAAVVAWQIPAASSPRQDTTTALPVMTVREACQGRAYRALLVSSFCNGWSTYGSRVALLPLFAVTVPGMGVGWAGVALTVFAAGDAAALSVAGRLVDVWGRKPLVLIGLVVNGIATAVIGFSTNAPALLTVSFVAGVGAGILIPAQQACAADVIGHERSGGKVLAAVQMAQDAGTIVGPILAGMVADIVGFSWAFGIAGVLMVIAVAAWLPAPETLPVVVEHDGPYGDPVADPPLPS
ncbi:MFS transporter [Austwickia sp. TVS 96-490-7B]|uniref:MFS transporter n=1 Tax=Austwickia sp. TVS 96-490-7B TaxID=2830843 RepID=UPI001C56BAA9|nr:MFS transporter [Austwickia sp. TVS 96-490-7B]